MDEGCYIYALYLAVRHGIASLHRPGVEHVVAEPEGHLAGGVLILRVSGEDECGVCVCVLVCMHGCVLA